MVWRVECQTVASKAGLVSSNIQLVHQKSGMKADYSKLLGNVTEQANEFGVCALTDDERHHWKQS